MTTKVRFAPSPTGPLHLGHAYSAVLAHRMAREAGGQFLPQCPSSLVQQGPDGLRAARNGQVAGSGAHDRVGLQRGVPGPGLGEVVELHEAVQLLPVVGVGQTLPGLREHGLAVEAYAPLGQAKDLDLPAITRIAQEKGVTPGQVVLRWHLQEGRIVIPKSVTPERIASNIDLFGFELSQGDMAEITGLDTDTRLFPNPDEANFTQMD